MTQSGGLKTLFLSNSLEFSKKWGEGEGGGQILPLRGPCRSLVLEVRYGMKILNLSCKKCRKIYILKVLGVYTFDVVSQSAQSFLQ